MLTLAVPHMYVHAQEDGPAPVNTTQSVSAGADLDIAQHGSNDASGEPQHPAGTYTGVVPGAASPPPAAAIANKGPTTITWPGFQMRPDGTSRVFLQSTGPLDAQPSAAPGKFLVHMPGARIVSGTNRLPLDTRFFNTPVTRVSLNVDHGGATLELDLRADVAPQLSSQRGSTGYYFTFIELPKGNYVHAAEQPSAAENAQSAAPAPAAPARSHIHTHVHRPDELTRFIDDAPSAPAADGNADDELPPGIKPRRTSSGSVRLGR